MSSTTRKQVLQYSSQPWNPARFQKRAVKWLLEHAGAALLMDPGLRKTSCTLGAIKILLKEGVISRVLVVAPLRVAGITWPNEIEKWTDFSHLRYVVLHGPNKDKLLDTDADIYLINPEGLEWLLTREKIVPDSTGELTIEHLSDLKKLKKLSPDVLVVDESTKFKNTGSARFKWLKPALRLFGRRWILTGTPAPNGLLDLFGQIMIVDEGRSLGQYISHYRKKYFNPSGFGGYTWDIKKGAEQLVYKALKPYVLRMEAADYIELPMMQDNNIVVVLPPKARKVYDEMEKEMISILDGKTVSAVSLGVAQMKCEQIASGAVYKNEVDRTKNAPAIFVHSEKTDALIDLLEQQQGTPTMILYWYSHEVTTITKALGKKFGRGAVLGGGVSLKAGAQIQADWNNNKLGWLLGHPASMGHGLNLQEGRANALVWYTLPWDLELYEQTWRRLVRSGSTHAHIMNHRLIARDTVDVAKITALRSKGTTQRRFLEAMKDYRSTRK